jgi:hypothetical protein
LDCASLLKNPSLITSFLSTNMESCAAVEGIFVAVLVQALDRKKIPEMKINRLLFFMCNSLSETKGFSGFERNRSQIRNKVLHDYNPW